MQKLTVKDFAKRKNVSEKTVYSWVKKDQVNYTVETVQGRSVTYILVPYVQAEVNEVNELVTDVEQNNSSRLNDYNSSLDSEKLLEFMKEMTKYIEAAGQVKLLTDSENQTKSQYFQLVQENKVLLQEKTRLETTTGILTEQINDLKKEAQEKKELKVKLEELKEKLKVQEEKRTGLVNWFRRL